MDHQLYVQAVLALFWCDSSDEPFDGREGDEAVFNRPVKRHAKHMGFVHHTQTFHLTALIKQDIIDSFRLLKRNTF